MATSKTKEHGGAAVAERPVRTETQAAALPVTPPPATSVGAPRPAVAPGSAEERFRPRAQNWDTASTERHRMGSRRPKGLGRAKAIGRRSPEAAAFALVSFAVTLLCLYVGAYARVTAQGFEKERLRETLREAHAEERALHAEVSRLQMPDNVRARAKLLGLVPGDAPALNLVTSPQGTPAADAADSVKETP